MHQKIKDEIAQNYYLQNFPNDGQRFVAWYLRNIHNLTPFEAKDCITDGPGDKQIDAIYVDHTNSKVFIIQGKFYSGEQVNAEPLREILSSWIQIKDLQRLQEAANAKLKIKIQELSSAIEDDYEICFELIISSQLTQAANYDLESFKLQIAEDENINANLAVIDNDTLKFLYDESINKSRPYLNHKIPLISGNYVLLEIGDAKAAIVALPLKECIKIPGIKDGSLFRKNVRQSLGLNNKVNKGIAKTLKNDIKDFFFYHNGITAICSKMDIRENTLILKELNVVNGCQSLNTIYSCSESVRNDNNGFIMFRFYEISDPVRAEKISTYTNSQSAVKARDLRSNDKSVLSMKKAYEQAYPDGYFVTKRGENPDITQFNSAHIVYLTNLGKQLIAWHSQRPTISYSESKIFDKYFDQLFHKDYSPDKIQALNELYLAVIDKWSIDNPLQLREELLAMKAYAPYHQLFAISCFFCEINKMPEAVPNPAIAFKQLKENDLLETIITMSGNCLNMAFETAIAEYMDNNKVLVPPNWIKAKASIKDIRAAIKNQINTLKIMPEGRKMIEKLNQGLKMSADNFESRWTAD